MHPTTPPTPSRRAPKAPKNPRRRVRSESDRKKHAGWRHCPRCNRSVSTNGRNFYHHMHKCDRVYFADLIAKVDSAVAPVSTPLPPPVPRVQSSPITPTQTPKRTPVKMSEMQRVVFLQQLCFLRVYDRTVDAVLKQIEQTDASIFSSAAFEAVRRAKGIEAPQRVFPNPKPFSPPFSPPYSPLAPPVHRTQQPAPTSVRDNFVSSAMASSSSIAVSQPHITTPAMGNAGIVNGSNSRSAQVENGGSDIPNGAAGVNTPYSSNGSLSVSASMPGNGANHVVNPGGAQPRMINAPPVSGSGSAQVMQQGSIQRHSISALPSSNGHMPQDLQPPVSSGTTRLLEQPGMPVTVTGNVSAPQPNTFQCGTGTVTDGRAISEPMGFPPTIGDGMSRIGIRGQAGGHGDMPPSRSVPIPSSGSVVPQDQAQRNDATLGNSSMPQTQQTFPPTSNNGNGPSGTHANLGMGRAVDSAMTGDGNWRRDPQRFSAPAGTAPYGGNPYVGSGLPVRSQMPPMPSSSVSAAAVANTPVSRVASAMSISSVINT